MKSSKKEVVARTAVVLISDGCKGNILVRAWKNMKSSHLSRTSAGQKIEGRIVNFERGFIKDRRESGAVRIIDFFCVKSTHLSRFPSAFDRAYQDLGENPPNVFLVAARVFVADALLRRNWMDCGKDKVLERKFLKSGAECRANMAFLFSRDNSCLDEDVLKILQALERHTS